MKTGKSPIQPHMSEGPGALYRQAKRLLLQRIERQEWPPGQALPNETTLAAELKVSIGTLRRAVDAGVNFLDTADVYHEGESERLVGAAIERLEKEVAEGRADERGGRSTTTSSIVMAASR
mgnify:CR=1 FL=1